MGWGEPQGTSTAITYDACPYCGQHANLAEHTALRCKAVKAVTLRADGSIARIEFDRG